MKKSNDRHLEETVLRELFRTYDRDNNGIVTVDILRQLLEKADVTTSE
jgi:Ca2+-binding EF-hand superfamily protein